MQKLDLRLFRAEVGVGYDAAFLYLSVRGAVAERWGHLPGFGRHLLSADALRLTNKLDSQIAETNLKSSRFVVSGPAPSWESFISDSEEFLTDCLKAFQPAGVSSIYADLKFYSEMPSFSAARDVLASQLLAGEYRRPPTEIATLEDVSIALAFKENDIVINTTLAPMYRHELGPHLDGEPDLSEYPDELLFVERRYDIRYSAETRPARPKVDAETACSRLESLVKNQVANAPTSVSEYVDHLLTAKKA